MITRFDITTFNDSIDVNLGTNGVIKTPISIYPNPAKEHIIIKTAIGFSDKTEGWLEDEIWSKIENLPTSKKN